MAAMVFRSWRLRFLVPLVALVAAGCSGPDSAKPTLTLFVAASLTEAIKEIGERFAAERDVELVYNFASSGALAQQILAAPRADLFVSASERWMAEVERKGRLLEGSRVLLSNRLAIVAHPDSGYALASVGELCALPFAFLAMGDPNSVPAGRYAKDFLNTVDCGEGTSAWLALRGRISPAPDVRAALGQVAARRDVIGLVYRTDARSRPNAVKVLRELSAAEGPAIRYPVGILKESTNPELAREFAAYLRSPAAREVFERTGFIMAEEVR